MATFGEAAETVITKMLLIGDTGAGKTGAVSSLLAAGYNVRILDMDAGVAILRDYLMNPASIYLQSRLPLWPKNSSADLLARLDFQTITDQMKNVNGKLVPKTAKAWTKAMETLNNWPKFGPIADWTDRDVLVIDSLTFLCSAALNFVLAMNARLGQAAHQSDWFQAQQLVESMLQMLYDSAVHCNIVVNCHLVYIGDDGAPQRGYPASLGKALSPRIGRYFNSVLMARTTGSGEKEKHRIVTKSTSMLELKSTVPLRIKGEYDLETGLLEYFLAERGK